MSEIVMPECMKQRRAKLLNATYEYFLAVLEMDRNEAALNGPVQHDGMKHHGTSPPGRCCYEGRCCLDCLRYSMGLIPSSLRKL